MDSPNPNPKAGGTMLTLEEGRAILSLYESMMDTVRARDWDRLAEIEQQAAAIRDASAAHPPVGVEDAEELRALLTRIQYLGHEIRRQVEPEREQVRQHLATEIKGRSVRKAYGDSRG